MRGRNNVNPVIGAFCDINVRNNGRLHYCLNSRRFLVVQNSSPRDIYEFENRFNSSNSFVSDNIVNSMFVKMVFKFAICNSNSSPIISRGFEISVSTVNKDEISVPRTLVFLSEQLAVQSDLAVF